MNETWRKEDRPLANSEFTKNLIAGSTKELIRETTIDKITVVKICEKAGISRRNFYRYFNDKYDVVNYIYYHDHLIKWVYNDNWTIWDYFPEICRELYSDRKFYANAFKDNAFRNYCYQKLYPLIYEDFEETFDNEETAKFYIRHICDLCFDYFIIWLSRESCTPPDEFAHWVRHMVTVHSQKQYELASRPSRSETEGYYGPGVK